MAAKLSGMDVGSCVVCGRLEVVFGKPPTSTPPQVMSRDSARSLGQVDARVDVLIITRINFDTPTQGIKLTVYL